MTQEQKNQLFALVMAHLSRNVPSERHVHAIFEVLVDDPSDTQMTWLRSLVETHKRTIVAAEADVEAEKERRRRALASEKQVLDELLDAPGVKQRPANAGGGKPA